MSSRDVLKITLMSNKAAKKVKVPAVKSENLNKS